MIGLLTACLWLLLRLGLIGVAPWRWGGFVGLVWLLVCWLFLCLLY